jgi:hypothetical protein
MFRVISFGCFGIIAKFIFCFVLGNAHSMPFLDVRTKSFIGSTTDVADYISSVVVFYFAEFRQRIISSSIVIVPVATLTHSSIGTVCGVATL